jgi:hypothetical protein
MERKNITAADGEGMETKTMTIAEFIKDQQIEMTATRIQGRANKGDNDQWEKTARHFSCTLRQVGKGNPRTMTIEYSQGSAHTHAPTCADVLNCLADDSRGWDNARSFEDWCSDCGYDTDSRRAERTYQAGQTSR